MTHIHQLLSGAGPVDAVTSQAVRFRALFAEWGMAGRIHAAAIEPRLDAGVLPLSRLDPAPDDLLLIHYSAYAPRLEPLLALPQRKLLVYHNVTPARYLWSHHPHVATLCELGRDHLPRYAQAVDVACGVSEYNAAELREAGARDVRVVPILFDPPRIERAAGADDGPPRVLTVGRLVPHKRQDLVIRAFALYQRARAPEATLACVGEPLSAAYRDWLAALAEQAGAAGVELPGPVSDGDLRARYGAASVFVTLSEHEGFCVPLLEAFAAVVPVVARRAGGMPEVGGDAVLWADDDDDLGVVAELIHLAASDDELRAELATRGRARLEEFAYERTAAKLRAAIDAAMTA